MLFPSSDFTFTLGTPLFPAMSSVSNSTLGIGGSDSGGSIQQPMVEREVVLIGDSLSEEVPRKVFDNGSSFF